MANVRLKTTITMRMEGVAKSHSRTDVGIRGLHTVIDEPIERGGTNLGMSPTETFVASLVACTNVISHKVAHRHGIELRDMKISIAADFDRRGVTLAEEVAVPFPAMTMTIDVRSDASTEQLDLLRKELAMFCPISKLVRASGTDLNEIWNVLPLAAGEST